MLVNASFSDKNVTKKHDESLSLYIYIFLLFYILKKKIEFHKGKSDCKAIVIAAWGLRKSPGGVLGARPQIFWLFNVFQAIKQLKMALTTILIA